MDKDISKESYKLWGAGESLEAGKMIYEAISNDDRPVWASEILSCCLNLTHSKSEFLSVLNTARDPKRWKNAHEIFQSVRELTLKDEAKGCPDLVFSGVLHLAENTAKVTYNASNPAGPFDDDSGWWILENLKFIVGKIKDKEFEDRILKVALEFGEDEQSK